MASIFELFNQFRATETECKQTTSELYTVKDKAGIEHKKIMSHTQCGGAEREKGEMGELFPVSADSLSAPNSKYKVCKAENPPHSDRDAWRGILTLQVLHNVRIYKGVGT